MLNLIKFSKNKKKVGKEFLNCSILRKKNFFIYTIAVLVAINFARKIKKSDKPITVFMKKFSKNGKKASSNSIVKVVKTVKKKD